jgi:hypothetical protein
MALLIPHRDTASCPLRYQYETATCTAMNITDHLGVKSHKLQASAFHREKGGELAVGLRRICLRKAGDARRTFPLTIAALPDEVCLAVLASRHFAFLLTDDIQLCSLTPAAAASASAAHSLLS